MRGVNFYKVFRSFFSNKRNKANLDGLEVKRCSIREKSKHAKFQGSRWVDGKSYNWMEDDDYGIDPEVRMKG